MANRPKSIRKALERGAVIRVERPLCYDFKNGYQIYVKYFTPISLENGWSLKGEWFQCSVGYFNSFVRKHRNFKA